MRCAEVRGYLGVHTRVHRPDISSDKRADSRPALTIAEGEGEGEHGRSKGANWKQIGFARYCSFESEYRGDSFSFPSFRPRRVASLLAFSLLSESKEEKAHLSLSRFFRVRRLETCTPSVNLDANASLSGLQIESGLATCLS